MPLRAVLGLRQNTLNASSKTGRSCLRWTKMLAGGLVELAAPPDVDVLGGPHHVQHVGRAGVQSQAPQNLGKAQQVGQNVAVAASTVAVEGVEVGGHGRLD